VNSQTDQELLQNYVEQKSDSAFATLVERYVDLVHSAALRMSGDPHSAKDITQCVFVALSQNAQQLTDRPTLAGWLHNTARNLAAKDIRSQIRRRSREQEAAVMNQLLTADSSANWDEIAPHLDAALGELSESERDAVLLRYFKNEDLRTVGATFGISDDAAQKRVSRAVERLRELFAKRGVSVGASGLAVGISANAVQAAPIGLALTISTAAALTGTTLATTATVTATKAIAMTALQKTIVTATVAVLAGVGIYEASQASQLRGQVQTLREQQAEQTQALQTERREATERLSTLAAELERAKGSSELLKLRGEIARLRNQGPNANDPMDSAARDLLAKVDLLKQRIEAFPEGRIPEIQYLTETDWLNLAVQLEPKANSSARSLLIQVRITAKERFAAILAQGLRSYARSNTSRLPDHLVELKPYFEAPVEDRVLERYQLLRSGNLDAGSPGEMVVSEKGIIDNMQDTLYSIGPYGYSYKVSLGTNLVPGNEGHFPGAHNTFE